MFKNKSSSTKTMLGLGAAAATFLSAGPMFANTTTISGTGWVPTNNIVSYGGYKTTGGTDSYSAGYSSSYSGSALMTITNSAYWTEAWVGTPPAYNGNLGALRYDSMSITVPSTTGPGQPYTLFGVSDVNGDSFDIINFGSNTNAYTLDGSSTVGVWNNKTQTWAEQNVQLSSIYDTPYNGIDYGDMMVNAAWASIGAYGSSGNNATAYISSMSITSTPEPATLGLLSLGGLGLLLKRRRKAIA